MKEDKEDLAMACSMIQELEDVWLSTDIDYPLMEKYLKPLLSEMGDVCPARYWPCLLIMHYEALKRVLDDLPILILHKHTEPRVLH